MATWIIGSIIIGAMVCVVYKSYKNHEKGGCSGCDHCPDAKKRHQ